jgi:hypothetical protein
MDTLARDGKSKHLNGMQNRVISTSAKIGEIENF